MPVEMLIVFGARFLDMPITALGAAYWSRPPGRSELPRISHRSVLRLGKLSLPCGIQLLRGPDDTDTHRLAFQRLQSRNSVRIGYIEKVDGQVPQRL
jgi:hypothetical protein